MRRLFVLVGLPCAGKTHFALHAVAKLARASGMPTLPAVSSDEVREMLVGQGPYDRRFNKRVFGMVNEILDAQMACGGEDLCVDSLALVPRDREDFIHLARENGVKAIAVHVDTPLQICLERNAARRGANSFLPPYVIEHKSRALVAPELAEGFHSVLTLRKCAHGPTTVKGEWEPVMDRLEEHLYPWTVPPTRLGVLHVDNQAAPTAGRSPTVS